MTLLLRLAWLLLTRSSRPSLDALAGASRLVFRVWPLDLDLSLHMNNSRYLAFMDLGRIDLLARAGLWSAARRQGWTPVASMIAIRYRRELRFLDRFRLETRLLAWTESAVVLEQVFWFESGARDGEIAARALFKGGLYDRAARRFVPTARLLAEAGVAAESPPASAEVEAFLKTDEAMRSRRSM